MMPSDARTREADELDRKYAERDELTAWLAGLQRGPDTDLEAAALVRSQLERVVHNIARLRDSRF